MSYARSPRLVCSTTMGTRAMGFSVRDVDSWRRRPRGSGLRGLRRLLGCLFLGHLCVLEEEIEDLAPRQHVLDPALALRGRKRPELLCHPAARGQQLAQLLTHLGLARPQILLPHD